MRQVRVHGRGGQGVVTAAEMLARTGFMAGHEAQAIPSFGSERPGAPVIAYCRFDDRPLRTREPVLHPDVVLVQDPTLLASERVFDGVPDGGVVIVNTEGDADDVRTQAGVDRPGVDVITVPAMRITMAQLGTPKPSAAMSGAYAAVSDDITLEAIQAALAELGNDEVQVTFVGGGVGGITENDVNLALTSGAIILGFNVRADGSARKLAEAESIEVRYYSIIYQLIDEVKGALSGMLDPERVEEIVGIADVRDVFRSPKFGQVAGCMVVEGAVYRNKPIRVLRDNVVIFEGELESLRRFKDDVNEVRNGMECGIGVKNYDVKVGDQIEVFDVKEVAREL